MSESKKIMIGLGVVGLICLCLVGIGFLGMRSFANNVESMVDGDPTQVAKMHDKIAEFDVPAGYQPMAMSIFMYDVVTLMPIDSKSEIMIMLMQFSGTATGSAEQIEEQLKQAAEQQGDQSISMEVVDTFERVIRGEKVTVAVSEGENQGIVFRQWMTVFQGNKGPVILMIQGPAEEWDEEVIDDFIKSIR